MRYRTTSFQGEAVKGSTSLAQPPHIVDILIAERAGGLCRNPLVWRAVRQVLFPLLHYREAKCLADAIQALPGAETMDHVARELAMEVEVTGLDRIPADGSYFLICNHPTGIADGVALWQALREKRPDLCFLANRDALRVSPRLNEIVLPVEWNKDIRSAARTRDALVAIQQAVKAGRAITVFPSGRISYLTMGGLKEREWLPTIVKLATKFKLPVIPLHLKARNSAFFYAASRLSTELRDITLFNEMLNKRGRTLRLTVGERIDPDTLRGDVAAVTAALQGYVGSGAVIGESWDAWRTRGDG
ncbi:1-acyl-sn-glycerol-3-phosphate acyltransferase [Inquilinus sp. CAU 1745]|uniref:1-acyl-sn-glycerol-3-phosphate acyltransferase n=1 Tax=Inquilinus sp. CAU 1745 TaxID=3140369 RepID=UPI00325AD877